MLDKSVITKKVHEIKRLKAERELLDQKIKELESYIKDQMEEQSVYEFVGKDYKVSWNLVKSSRLNQKLLEKSYPSIYESCRVTSESRRFLIS